MSNKDVLRRSFLKGAGAAWAGFASLKEALAQSGGEVIPWG
jgi:hypothetical protein